ncbi:MAG: carboxypeptidase-like regulatory domain-containing protein, partial [Bacteroidota bacterium]
MNQFLVAIAIAIIPFISSAQKNLLIQGKVIQKSNSEAIQWASISIKNRPLGTVSGKDGSFEFHFSADYTNDEFMISHIGFKTYTIKVKDAVAMGNTIYYLEEDSVNLPEIHVLAKQLTAHQIIKKAISAVQKNYPTTPFALDAFYRDYKKVNGEYVSLLEAAVSIYDPGYARKSGSEQVTVDEIRRSKRYINEYEGFV